MKLSDLPISLGEYRGLILSPIEIATSEEAVLARMKELLEATSRPEPTNESIRQGDKVEFVLSWRVGKKDPLRVKNGSYSISVGKHDLIPGFEERLLGHQKGDAFDFAMNFPIIHVNEDLQGRLAHFDVEIREVLRVPDDLMTDEYVQSVSEFESADELRRAIWDQMEAENRDEMVRYLRGCARNALVDACDVDIPDSAIDEQVEAVVEDLRESLGAQGMTLADHASRMGKSVEDFVTELRSETKKGMTASLALEEIARIEGIEVLPDDFDREIDLLSASADASTDEIRLALENDEFESAMRASILEDKVLNFILQHAIISEGEAFSDEM